MGRYRSRSRSYSPRARSRSRSYSPLPIAARRTKRYDDPRDRYRGGGGGGGGGRDERASRNYTDRRSSAPSGLLIRNVSLDTRPEELRAPFERFGPVKDVYLPKNYYTGEPRGFGFVKFRNPEDASEAKEQMNHQVIGGREITIVFAEENRKTPAEMRQTTRVSGRSGGGYRRRSPLGSPRHRYRSYSRSPSPRRYDTRERDCDYREDDYYSPESGAMEYHDEREYRSHDNRDYRSHDERDYRSHPDRSLSPRENGRSPVRARSISYSPR